MGTHTLSIEALIFFSFSLSHYVIIVVKFVRVMHIRAIALMSASSQVQDFMYRWFTI